MLPRRRGGNMYHALYANPSVKHTVGSTFMAQRLETLGCQNQKFSKVPMGVDLNKFKFVDRSERTSSVLKIVSVGRLEEVKGHCYLIDAVVKLMDMGVSAQLRIIGEGSLREPLESQIEESSAGGYIELLGAQNTRVVRRELASADLFALAGVEASSGSEETQGVVLIEAQATGLPVVASRVGGIPDSMIHGETGTLCEPKNIDQLVEAIQGYTENLRHRLAHGRAASQFVQQRFSLSTMLDSFEALYDRI
jgi:colanic acid/amylovoran biosynthesis glycosyltransferase